MTARLFTAAEGAQYHCGVGNLDLVLDMITNWIDFVKAHPDDPTLVKSEMSLFQK